MSNNTPSRRRREGREAYFEGSTDSDKRFLCPYRDNRAKDWYNRWELEEKELAMRPKEKQNTIICPNCGKEIGGE